MKQILFPTNFSDDSKVSFNYAIQLSEAVQAQLVVYNSYYSTESPKRTFLEIGTRYDETIRKLNSFIKSEKYLGNKPIMLKAEEGYATKNIIKNSKKPRVELVLMNRSKSYDLVDKLVGTRLSYVSSGSYCPVMVLPPAYTFKNIDKVLVHDSGQTLSSSNLKDLLFRLFGEDSQKMDFVNNFIRQGKNPKLDTKKQESWFISPKSLRKEKSRIKDNIAKNSPDLLIMVLNKKGLIKKFLENIITLPLITELNIPVLVLNQNTLETRDYGFSRYLDKVELRA
jgi:hypothetical protein